MKRILLFVAIAVLTSLAVSLPALAQSGGSYDLSWNTIDGGGSVSTGGGYTLTGTVGQPDVGGALTGGNFTLAGGYWSNVPSQIKIYLPLIFKKFQ